MGIQIEILVLVRSGVDGWDVEDFPQGNPASREVVEVDRTLLSGDYFRLEIVGIYFWNVAKLIVNLTENFLQADEDSQDAEDANFSSYCRHLNLILNPVYLLNFGSEG